MSLYIARIWLSPNCKMCFRVTKAIVAAEYYFCGVIIALFVYRKAIKKNF